MSEYCLTTFLEICQQHHGADNRHGASDIAPTIILMFKIVGDDSDGFA